MVASKMEDGAHFKLEGKANLRLDASLGLGVSVPALNYLVNAEAGGGGVKIRVVREQILVKRS